MLAGCAIAVDMLARSATLIRTVGSYTGGRWVDGAPTTTTISGVLLSVPPTDLRDLPEGQRHPGLRAFWTRSDISAGDETNGVRPDELIVSGQRWRVIAVNPRREGGYTKAIVEAVHDRSRVV